MKVILENTVIGLGEEGDIVEVSSGYARNYLFPQKMAKQNTQQNRSVLESRRDAINKRREEYLKTHMSVREKLQDERVTITMNVGKNGQLFGSVTSAVISDELEKKGINVAKKNILLPSSSIKTLGIFSVEARLYQGVDAKFTVVVQDKDGNTSVAKVETEDEYNTNEQEASQTTDEETSNEVNDEAVQENVEQTTDEIVQAESNTATSNDTSTEESAQSATENIETEDNSNLS